MIEIGEKLAPDKFSFVSGVGISFRPRDSRAICSDLSVVYLTGFLSQYCLRDSMVLKKRFLSLIFLRSFLLRFLAALLSLRFAFPFPFTSKESDKRQE